MKKFWTVLVTGFLLILLVGCESKEVKPDYSEADAETALNEGKDLEGKTVEVNVAELVPDSAFGYNIQAGEHLNFVSTDNPKVEKGDTLVLKIINVKSVTGSFIISYEKVK
ncbi:hypothetical protein [Enterococcus sp. LJL51]|uniref:hypothetical protein n=1 Tax=Enterococcus sp. LJL51 TaxID=3416656 RepID=UPI003CFBAFFA